MLRGGDLSGLDDGLGRESHSRVCKGTEAACCREMWARGARFYKSQRPEGQQEIRLEKSHRGSP